MKFLFSWGLPIIALILGVIGAVLAAKVSGGLFWAGWLPGLACIAIFLIKDKESTPIEEDSTEQDTIETPQES